MANQAKLNEVFSDEIFVKNLLTLETVEEVQAALQTKDLDLKVEEIFQMKNMIAQNLNAGEELSEAELDNVAGGVVNVILPGVIGAICGPSLKGVDLQNSKW